MKKNLVKKIPLKVYFIGKLDKWCYFTVFSFFFPRNLDNKVRGLGDPVKQAQATFKTCPCFAFT